MPRGRPRKDGVKISCRIDSGVYSSLRTYADEHGMTFTKVIEFAVKEYVGKRTAAGESEGAGKS